MKSRFVVPMLLVTVWSSTGDAAQTQEQNPEAIEFFETKIRPLLANNCYNCHSANTNSQGGLRLDDRNGQLVGGGSGPALIPGDVENSLLIKVVEHADGVASMPPKKKLTDEEIADLKHWVATGAAWPQAIAPEDLHEYDSDYDSLRQSHWAWQPLTKPSVPEPIDREWPRDDIDRFIQDSIERKGLQRSAQADRLTLLRRVSYDLTGLPPTSEEEQAFLADESEDALSRVVDRLLASRAFGERWGRHWLDIARYGESTGSSRNLPLPHAWRYRDYVIDAFAKDKPFDRFIVEQIAGDLLPYDSEPQREEQLIATGYLAIGVKDVNQRYKVRFVMDNVDEQIDTVSRSLLGITASCARCHHHKFDPIPTQDYYALAGIFTSTDMCAGLRNRMGGAGLAYYDTDKLIAVGELSDPSGERADKIAEAKEKFQTAQKEFQSLRNDPKGDEKLENGRTRRFTARQAMNKAQEELVALSDPARTSKVILGVRDAKEIGDTELRYRGEAEQLGPKVPRGFLSIVQWEGQPSIPKDQSGRLELAQWIASPSNPLTSRVIVNRVWKHLFGRGIVSTVDNFGINGDVPTHPELLDHLVQRFHQDGWSVKRLVRQIVLSKTYQLSSQANAHSQAIDPANRWVWRHSSRRLDAEELRDTILTVAGVLETAAPQGSAAQDLKVIELPNNGPIARGLRETAAKAKYRSVYLPLVRGVTPNVLEVFDFAEQGTVTGARSATTVPPQSLFLLNDAFVRRNSIQLAEHLQAKSELQDKHRVSEAFRTVLGRTPSELEVEQALAFIQDTEGASEILFDLRRTTEELSAVKLAALKASATEEEKPSTESSSEPAAESTGKATKPVPPIDPDQIVEVEPPLQEEKVFGKTPREAAWASFIQALIGSAEFRYLR